MGGNLGYRFRIGPLATVLNHMPLLLIDLSLYAGQPNSTKASDYGIAFANIATDLTKDGLM